MSARCVPVQDVSYAWRMGKATDTRERMVRSAALLLREEGVRGTSFPKVLEHAEAPRGSLGHHFPGGKREMVADAVRWSGGLVTRQMDVALERGASGAAIVEQVVALYRDALVPTDFRAGCPVGAVAQEAFDDQVLRDAVAGTIGDWRTALRSALARDGFESGEAEQLADLAISSVEGALLLCRVDRTTDALDRVAVTLARILVR